MSLMMDIGEWRSRKWPGPGFMAAAYRDCQASMVDSSCVDQNKADGHNY